MGRAHEGLQETWWAVSRYLWRGFDGHRYGYEDLVRPDGTVVTTITEPEDRNGFRDLRAVADELNALHEKIAALVEALHPFAEPREGMDDRPCHAGITTPESCGRCSRALAASAAIAKAEGR